MQQINKRSTGAGRKSHPIKGNALTITTRLYPIDRAYLESRFGSVNIALKSLCSGNDYNEYLNEQINQLKK